MRKSIFTYLVFVFALQVSCVATDDAGGEGKYNDLLAQLDKTCSGPKR